MTSVRTRLMLVLGAGFAVLLAAIVVYLSSAVSDRLVSEFDETLLVKAQALAALTEEEKGQIEFDYTPDRMPEFERSDRPEYFQFWLDDGTTLLRSKHLKSNLGPAPGASSAPMLWNTILPDGRMGRVVRLAWTPKSGAAARDPGDSTDAKTSSPSPAARGVTLYLARDREGLDRMVGEMGIAISGAGALALLLALVLVSRALAVGFRPIDAIAAQVKELGADRLDARVSVANAPRELAPVVLQLNALLDRLAASMERERRFAGNVAHELRTPIAELRSLAAVGAKWPDDPASVAAFFGDVEEVARRMESLVTDLLLLARCQAGVEGSVREPTNLAAVVDTEWSVLAASAAARGLHLHADLPADLAVVSDPGKLSIVLRNLLGNAVAYATAGGEVRCVGRSAGRRFHLSISNPSEPMSREDLARVDEPFWRGDPARASSDHAGLGLSLVSALARLLRLDVHYEQDADGTFRVRLEGEAAEGPVAPPASTIDVDRVLSGP